MKDLPVVVFLDHLLIMGHSEKEHRDILQEVLQHLRENDLQVQHSKCEFSKTQVDYLSHILDKQVIHPSKDEVRAIQEAPSPTNVKELQAFLGLGDLGNMQLGNGLRLSRLLFLNVQNSCMG